MFCKASKLRRWQLTKSFNKHKEMFTGQLQSCYCPMFHQIYGSSGSTMLSTRRRLIVDSLRLFNGSKMLLTGTHAGAAGRAQLSSQPCQQSNFIIIYELHQASYISLPIFDPSRRSNFFSESSEEGGRAGLERGGEAFYWKAMGLNP
jgi:hypothetical protein